MAHGILGIDHTLIGVRDLERAAEIWRRLGFAVSPRGRHIGWGTGNYCVMFPDDYIELLGIVDPGQFLNNLDTFLAEREGGLGLAWASRDRDATVRSLATAGIETGASRDLARALETAEGTVQPRFKLAHLPAEVTPGLSSFICQHETPVLLRRPHWLMHANAAIALKGVTVLHPAPGSLVDSYEQLFGLAAVTMTDDVMTLHVGRHRLIFADADNIEVLHPELDFEDLGEGPAIALMTLVSGDLDRTADHFSAADIDYEEERDGSIIVPAAEASGIALEFVGRR
jgi:hypothetical protein